MQESAPKRPGAEFVGVPIGQDDLPLSKYRHVFDIGTGIMQREYKRADEALDYRIDLMSWLDADESIVGVVGWTDPDTLVITRLFYADYSLVVWVAAGADNARQTVYIKVLTSKGREHLYRFAIVTSGTAPVIATVTLIGPDIIYVGKRVDPPVPEPEDKPEITVTPTSLQFPLTFVGSVSTPQQLVMKNTGKVPVYLRSISLTGDYHQKNTGEEILQPGDSTTLNITFKPTDGGERIGQLVIDINDGGKPYASFIGEAINSSRLSTRGNQFVDGKGTPVRLRSINWFGAESDIFVPHGLWQRSYKSIIDQIIAMGFNCIRLPLSGDLLTPGRGAPSGAINVDVNPELIGLTAIEVLDAVIAYCSQKEIYVVLDHHRRTAGSGADGSPVSESYPLDKWISNWVLLAQKYGENEHVIGADIHNEPYLLSWDTWAGYAEQCGNAIHDIAPDWIIFVEGVGTYAGESYWWGGQLQGVANRPVKLNRDFRLAYAPHEYGQSVGQQSWLAYDGQPRPANWPMNLYPVWKKNWGFIAEQDIAPIWIGEFGGKFGTDGAGNVGVAPNAEYESQWLYHLELYLNGDFNGDGTRDLPEGKEGLSFSYWSFNPNSGDTGGLVQDDWISPQLFKLRLLEPIMAGIDLNYLTSLTPIGAGEVGDADLTLVNHNGTDYSLRISELMKLVVDRTTSTNRVYWFLDNTNPNTLYPGTVWAAIPGLGKSVRIAAADGSDVGQQGGNDSITIQKGNLPETALSLTGTAASTDLGTKNTSQNGAHVHGGVPLRDNQYQLGGNNTALFSPMTAGNTDSAGDHTHTVVLGSHGHSVSGQTENMGSGQSINVTNAYIKLAAWYRVS